MYPVIHIANIEIKLTMRAKQKIGRKFMSTQMIRKYAGFSFVMIFGLTTIVIVPEYHVLL